jgi:hypothetical protein
MSRWKALKSERCQFKYVVMVRTSRRHFRAKIYPNSIFNPYSVRTCFVSVLLEHVKGSRTVVPNRNRPPSRGTFSAFFNSQRLCATSPFGTECFVNSAKTFDSP